MKIRVIGSSGAEFPGHNPPAFLLDDEILFDAGSITNTLDEKAQRKIRHIFITHAHLDHIKSIPFLADNIIVGGTNHRVTVLSIPPVLQTIKSHLFNSAMWPDFTVIPHPDDAVLRLVKLKYGTPVQLNGYAITPFKVNHTVPSAGYLIEDSKGRRIFYTGDTGPTAATWRKLGGTAIHCLIIDVSFPNGMESLAIQTGHLTPNLLKEELTHFRHLPEQICITHPKPQHLKVIEKEVDRLGVRGLKILKEGSNITI
jgi:ribonuclease BN (tRNA processing enzyme)